jgi:hypothetical protein
MDVRPDPPYNEEKPIIWEYTNRVPFYRESSSILPHVDLSTEPIRHGFSQDLGVLGWGQPQ